MKYRSIQVLRAVAALMVVIHHGAHWANGRAGVDLFFVISGVIMATIMGDERAAPFLARRAIRILPTYYAATLFLLVVEPGVTSFGRPLDSLLLLPGNHLYIEQAWTLFYEFIFYFCCAAFLAFGRRAWLLLPLSLLIGWAVGDPKLFDGWLAFEFVAGIAIVQLPRRYGLAAMVAGAALFFVMPETHRVLQFGIPAALLVFGALASERSFASRFWNPLVYLGDASYSLYLVHWVILILLRDILPVPLLVAAAAGTGVVFYRGVEVPLLRVTRQLVKHVGEKRKQEPQGAVTLP